MSRIFKVAAPELGQYSPKKLKNLILKLWLESLNHEQNSVSCTMLVRLLLRSKHWLEKRGVQDDHTVHAHAESN